MERFEAKESAETPLRGRELSGEAAQQEKYELTITAESVESTDERFTMDDLSLGNGYQPLDAYFQRASGETIRRSYNKGERKNSNQTMPRIAFQVFEKQIATMPVEDKESFPICRYNPNSDMICGIFHSIEQFREHRNSIEYLTYDYDNGRRFVIYCWNIFSTIFFVQECLKRFGDPGDRFVLTYREKTKKETEAVKSGTGAQDEPLCDSKTYRNPLSSVLIESKNIILRGAPGTGKTHLAKEIAADIISNGYFDDCTLLTDEQKQQIGFVQFHPSYDYSDFVEGLRPKMDDDGTMGFELRDGIFKQFVTRARENYESCQAARSAIRTSGQTRCAEVSQGSSEGNEPKKYIFIIDEINRGEISKILGELFFALDPGYRGEAGEVFTQYANLHADPNERFYIPDNVYIIGTMNDIDRSVDSFDFAMRRRFRFVELRADERLEMLASLEDEDRKAEAIERMNALNEEIAKTEGLNRNYQIGAAYFLKLQELDFDQLWTDHLQPLLQEYIQGLYDEEGIMAKFANAYHQKHTGSDADEAAQNQG